MKKGQESDRSQKLKDRIRLFVVAWSIGVLGGLLLWLLRITARVKVEGYNRRKLDPKDKGLILIHNHPSLWEPALLPFLFFPWYLFSLHSDGERKPEGGGKGAKADAGEIA